MSAHRHAAAIIAWANGAKIQFRAPRLATHNWHDCDHVPSWDIECEYRVKPEPRQLWVRPYNRRSSPYWDTPVVSHSYKEVNFVLPPGCEWVGPAVLVWEEK